MEELALKQPLTATVGRQDIFLGDGWLVSDGTPFDGSWTYFLDSARLAYELKDQQTVIEAIGIVQSARDADWMPVLNSGQNRYLTEQNEKGAILQIANTTMKSANLTGYFIYKHDDAEICRWPTRRVSIRTMPTSTPSAVGSMVC